MQMEIVERFIDLLLIEAGQNTATVYQCEAAKWRKFVIFLLLFTLYTMSTVCSLMQLAWLASLKQ